LLPHSPHELVIAAMDEAEPPVPGAPARDDNEDIDEEERAEVPLLESLDHYIRSRGIHVIPLEHQQVQDSNVFYSDANHAARSHQEGRAYQESIHREAFADHDEKESDVIAERERFLRSLEGKSIIVASCAPRSVPLDVLASTCDTVLQMALSQPMLDRRSSALPSSGQLTLDLEDFESDAVDSFLAVVTGNHPVSSVPDDHIVDVCRISHYVQCKSIFHGTVDIIKDSIDSDNCLSICHLADQLGVPSLFEASVSHLIERLDDMQGHEHWDDFPTTLRHRVITMRNAVHSSILGRGQKTAIFFSSSDEFLAIFSDNIREQRERLAEAKQRQQEVIDERIQKGGRHRDPYGGDVRYAAEKIEQQERRLETLETFYREQKIIFSSGRVAGNGSEGGGFQLGLC